MVSGKKLSKNPKLTHSRTIYSSYLRKNPKHAVSKKVLLFKPQHDWIKAKELQYMFTQQ